LCTQNARNALTRSVSIMKLRRDSMKLSLCKECKETCASHAQLPSRTRNLHKDLVQGVHRSNIQLSVEGALQEVEEPEEENVGRVRGISLREILRILSYRNPLNVRTVWEIKIFMLRRNNIFHQC
jgi:hypothetical protein